MTGLVGPTVLSAAVLLAGLRLWGVKAQWFQATAHLFVGFLVGWAVFGDDWRFPAYVTVTLSVVELGRFLWDRFRGKK